MATTRKSTRRNRKSTINVTASSTISQLPPVPPTSASNSALLSRRQIMPPAPPPPRMQPTIPPSASTVLPSSSLRPFQTLLPFPSSLVPSSQQLSATAAALSSSWPLSTSARVALPSTLSSASTAPPLPPWTKRQKQQHNGHSHSINATPTILHPPLLPAVSSSAIAAASTAPSLVPWMQHPLTSTNQRKRINDFIEQDENANNESGAASMVNKKQPPTSRSKYLPPVQFDSEVETVADKIRRKVENIMSLDERKKKHPEDSELLDRLCYLFQRFALLFYEKYVTDDGLEKRPLPKTADDRGGDYVWECDGRLTIGQTTNFVSRGKVRLGGDGKITKIEIEQRMSMLFTTAESMEVAESADLCDIFEEIAAMYHPRLACYAGNEKKRLERIARGLIEGSIAASTPAYVQNAYEDFLEKPSEDILRIISSPEVDQEYAECVGSIQTWLPFFTWEHFVSYLRRCAKKKEELSSDQIDFLRQVIIDLDCEFLQKHIYDRTMGGEGVTIEPFVDAVPGRYNPRVIELMKVVEELKKVLTEPVMESFKEDATTIPQHVAESVKEIVNGISNVDYVSPSDDVLAEGYASGLRKLKKQHHGEDDLAITMEFAVYNAICKDESLEKELFGDCEASEQNDIDGDRAEIFLRNDVGPHFRIIHSSHVPLGENNTDEHRVKGVKQAMTIMAVNNQAKILSDEAFEKERRIYCAFFMNWFGFGGSLNGRNGSFNLARSAAVGVGICNPHVVRPGAQMTGNAIGRGITGPAATLLRCLLERDRFDAVLTICRGEITNEDNPSPIDNPDQREVWAKKRANKRRRQHHQENKKEINERRRQDYHENKMEINKRRRQHYHSAQGQKAREQWLESEKGRASQARKNARQKEKRAQVSQKRKDDMANAIIVKARVAYKRYLELRGKNQLMSLSRSDLLALLKYISKKDPKVKYIEGTVENIKKRLGISLSDTNDPLSKYFTGL